MNNNATSSGFTLIEMMITLCIAGIMLAVATPSFRAILLKNTTITYTNDFKMALYQAQNEAITRNTRVSIQAKTTTNNLWEDGWNIFEDTNSNNSYDSASETLIRTYEPTAKNHSLKSSYSSFNTSIGFNSLGEPVTSSGASSSAEFRLCDPDNNTDLSRTLKVSFSGNITVSEGTSTCP